MTRAELAACNRLREPMRSEALAAFRALDSLSAEVDSFCADVQALKREADGDGGAMDMDAEWSLLQRRVDGKEMRQ